MTPEDLKAARKTLGLTAAGLGRALELKGRDPGRTITLWEQGRAIPGPARVAIRLMLAEKSRQSLQDAVSQARQAIAPLNPPPPVLEGLDAIREAAARNEITITRRRG